MRWPLISFMMLLITISVAAAFDWEFVEIGDQDSVQPFDGGEVEFLHNGFTLTAVGGEIWHGKLGCVFVHVNGGLSGDFTLEYTITEHTATPPQNWAKLGILLLKELNPSSPYLFIQASLPSNSNPGNDRGARLFSREQPDGNVGTGVSGKGWTPLQWPMTHKLVREGDVFTASISLDGGKTYESIADGDNLDNIELKFDDPVIVGFALCGKGNFGVTATATLVDIKINGQNALAVNPKSKLTTTWGTVKQ